WLQRRVAVVKAVPAALVVILAAVPLGVYFDLLHPHPYDFGGHTYKVGEDYLVKMPDRPFGLLDSIAFPDFSVFGDDDSLGPALKWMVLFFLIGTLESLLSAKAVDIIDPWRRKSNLD